MLKDLNEMSKEELIELIKYNQSIGIGDTELGRQFGVTREKIKYYRKKFDIDTSILDNYKLEQEMIKVNQVKEVLDKCVTIQDVSDLTGLTKSVVTNLMQKHNLKCNKKVYCLECGIEIPKEYNRQSSYCSDKCRYAYKYKNKLSKCKTCGKEFTGSRDYCSDECKRGTKLVCSYCGLDFLGFHTEKYCSDNCREKFAKERYEELRKREIVVKCEICGEPMTIKAKSKRQRICSIKCKNKFLAHRVDKTLMDMFNTTDENKIREIVRRKLNERASMCGE